MQGRREARIDLIRGLSLLLIFVGHAEFAFSAFIQQARGFSDASESFVLMAGMSAGLAYFSFGSSSFMQTAARTWRRARRLYVIHIALVALLVTVVRMPMVTELPSYERVVAALEVSAFWQDPLNYLQRVLTLRYMPADLDILPLYVLLLAGVPVIFTLYRRSPWLLLAVSGLLWLCAGAFRLNLSNDAIASGRWYFDPLSWQLVFTIGVVLGIRVKRGEEAFPYRPAVFAASVAFCLIAIPLNLLVHYVFTGLAESPLYHLLTTKVHVGALRLLNALALVYVVWNLDVVKRLQDWPPARSLYAAGRHSLPVFVTGIILSMTICAMMLGWESAPLVLQGLLMLLGIAIQLALAVRLEARARAARMAEAAL